MRGAIVGLVLGVVLAACTRASSPEPRDDQRSGAARNVPPDARPPAPPPRVEHIAAGKEHTCALLHGGGVRCWGAGANGRLGTGSTASIGDDETPATIPDIAVGGRAVQITAGAEHTCALLDTGSVRCWGAGSRGQLGYGNTRDIGDDEAPASAGDVSLGERATQIVAGGFHTCALLASGGVRCWGWNEEGQLGLGFDNRTVGDDEVPTAVPALDLGARIERLASDFGQTCALLVGGSVRCWGPALGTGVEKLTAAADRPAVALGVSAAQLGGGAGADHVCAITATGRVRCWGENSEGQLGYGFDASLVGVAPGKLPTPAELGDVPLAGHAVQVSTGGDHTCALLDTGRVRCWGAGRFGLLGQGGLDHVLADGAIEVDVGGRVVEIAAGGFHTCAVLDTGRVRCWGLNQSGQLGYGTPENVGERRPPSAAGDVPL
jgi:alpha-tubulin suppressor-like RCC1 family protein